MPLFEIHEISFQYDICDGLLYRLMLKTAVLLSCSLSILSPSYEAHKKEFTLFNGYIENDLLAHGSILASIVDICKNFTIIFSLVCYACHRHLHHLHTLKQTQIFAFIHILQNVILDVFAEVPFGNIHRFLAIQGVGSFTASFLSD